MLQVGIAALFGGIVTLFLTAFFQDATNRFASTINSRLPGRGSVSKRRTLDGIWKSRYWYPSTQQGETLLDEHFIVLRQGIGGVYGFSLRHPRESKLVLKFEVDGNMATGTWREEAPGRRYRGACQLEILSTKQELRGIWIGFAEDLKIRDGSWELEQVSSRTGFWAHRRFRDRAELAFKRPGSDPGAPRTVKACR